MNTYSLTINNQNRINYNKSNLFFEDEKYLLLGNIRFLSNKIKVNEILDGLIKSANRFLNNLDAEFSFCLLFKKEDKLLLARDKMGIKDIFYFIENNKVSINTNIFHLIKEKNYKKFSVIGVSQYLLFEYSKDPCTFFEDVYAVERGQFIEIDLNGKKVVNKVLFRKKLSEFNENNSLSEKEISKMLRNLIGEAHQKRMSDNNSVLLSGGIDSTVMAITLKNDLGDNNLHALTFDTIGAEQSEVEYAEYVAKKLKLNHQIIKVNPYKKVDLFDLVDRTNFPYVGSIMMSASMNMIDSSVSYNFFAGQDTRLLTPSLHKFDEIYLKYLKFSILNSSVEALTPIFKKLIKLDTKLKKKLYTRLATFSNKELYILENLFHFHPYSILIDKNNDFIEKYIVDLSKNLDIDSKNIRLIYNSFVDQAWGWQHNNDISYMTGNIEYYNMSSSMPFFDIKFSEFVATLPMNLATKVTKGKSGYGNKTKKVNKYLLREAYKNNLPNKIIYRDKAVAITNHIYLNTVMKSYISDLFINPKMKTTEVYEKLNLSKLIDLALLNNGKWTLNDYTTVVEVHNLLFLEIIARKYDIEN